MGKDGKNSFTFTTPEQLTSWKIKIFAFTKDVKEGTLTEEAITKKDLMVRVDLPRFFREKDIGTITTIVHNESEEILKGNLSIDVLDGERLVNEKLKLKMLSDLPLREDKATKKSQKKENKISFTIKPASLASFDWVIEIPAGISTYKVRAVVVADSIASKNRLTDAEERELPILPSRQRLIESTFTSLSKNESKKMTISLKEDKTRINESITLQIEPQLALSIINAIPFLVTYPYMCVEQMLNRYVPLAIINEIYKKYPEIQRATSKIPKRKTLTPSWEENDPKRLITLMETPWVWQSEGRPLDFPITDLLDPQAVEYQKEIAFEKLKSAQLSNGGFPWWPGGEADPYMTLYVLDGFAEVRRYGVNVPRDIISKALSYIIREIPHLLKVEERYLTLVSYSAYVITSFSPEDFPQAQESHKLAKDWITFLEKNIHTLTPFGKAYLAYTYLRVGNKKRANEILDMAMDGAREDPLTGVYWTPEKYSWLWYSDTVEKHAFFLRTLQELRPTDKRIPGMVQWLLFNRKGNVWKSTKASASAVYALLDFLNKQGALFSDENFKVKWGSDIYSAVVKADDWLEKPLRWQKTGFSITEDNNSTLIEKKGKGIAFSSLVWIYSTDQLPEASAPGIIELQREFYKRVSSCLSKECKKKQGQYYLKPLKPGDEVKVGDQIEIQLKINTRSQFEYMHLKDPKPAGFEAETLLSGWKYDRLNFYEEPRDSVTNFFISWLPHGEYIIRYRMKPTKAGEYRVGAATLQSMYAPEMTAHSNGFLIKVLK